MKGLRRFWRRLRHRCPRCGNPATRTMEPQRQHPYRIWSCAQRHEWFQRVRA